MTDLELGTAIDAAFRAGEAILAVYESADFEVVHKQDDSPLTLADTRSHHVIRDLLQPLGLPILSEEGRQMPYDQRRAWPRFWLVDPLDGTKEFIKRNGEFTVNIAIIEQHTPVLGVIYVPVTQRMFFAVKGQGAFRLDAFKSVYAHCAGQGATAATVLPQLRDRAVRLPEARGGETPYTVVGSRSHATPELQAYVEQLKQRRRSVDFISAGSSLKFCLVAEGRADQYPRLGPTMEWDTAAGQAIAECAGAEVVEFETHQPLRYNKPSLKNPYFVVRREE